MTTVSKAHALKTNEARSLCIAGGKICGAEMARKPARVSAINIGMAKPENALAQSLRQQGDPDVDIINNSPGSSFVGGLHLGHLPHWEPLTRFTGRE